MNSTSVSSEVSSHNYQLIRSSRRKTVAIIVHDDNRIEVRAPGRLPMAVIDRFVQSKAPWIEKKIAFNREVRSPVVKRAFKAGESLQLLGESYLLQIERGRAATLLQGQMLIIRLPLNRMHDPEAIKRTLERWYKSFAASYVQQRGSELAGSMGLSPALISIKGYRSRWGSCHADGRIYLNWRLIMAPERIIDYVLIHELSHLIHANHSARFWRLVATHAPDYREASDWLKINRAQLQL